VHKTGQISPEQCESNCTIKPEIVKVAEGIQKHAFFHLYQNNDSNFVYFVSQ